MREYLLLNHDKHLNPRRVLIYEVGIRGTAFTSLGKVFSLLFSVQCSLFRASGHPLLAKLGPGGTDSPCFGMGPDCLWDSEEQQRK